MIPFEEMDTRLGKIDKDRAWLAAESCRSPDHIRTILAPGSKRRSTKIQRLLSEIIEREETRRAHAPPPGLFQIFQTEEEHDRADRASRLIGSPSLADFCREAISLRAKELLAHPHLRIETAFSPAAAESHERSANADLPRRPVKYPPHRKAK